MGTFSSRVKHRPLISDNLKPQHKGGRTVVDEERFEIWGECESQSIEKELIDYAPSESEARRLVGEYTMAFGYQWYIWYKER